MCTLYTVQRIPAFYKYYLVYSYNKLGTYLSKTIGTQFCRMLQTYNNMCRLFVKCLF